MRQQLDWLCDPHGTRTDDGCGSHGRDGQAKFQRIDPLIEESETLSTLIAPARARDSGNTILTKEFRGGVLVLTGANSAVGLRSMPVRYLFLDEVDGYPGDVEGEGDAISLAEARTRTFARRKILIVSPRPSQVPRASSGSLSNLTSVTSWCHVPTVGMSNACSLSG